MWLLRRLTASVVGGRFGRSAVAEAGVQPFDVVGDGEPGAGPGGKRFSVVTLVLQRGEERYCGGVIPADPGAAEAGSTRTASPDGG